MTNTFEHYDDVAVDNFAAAMKQAMATARAQGKTGWQDKRQCTELSLRNLLRRANSKGDPVHVGNYAMMLFNRGERTAHVQAVALHAAVEASNQKAAVAPAADPPGFASTVLALNAALRALLSEMAGDLHQYENEEDEELQAPVQFAAHKVAAALLMLYSVGPDPSPVASCVREPYARRAAATPCEHDWPAGEGGTDLNGTCTKCGMAFQYMIHMEMP